MTMTVAIANPVEIQVISWTVAPTAPRICGSATFTIDESIAPMSVPNVTETVTSHLFGTGRAAAIGAESVAVLTGVLPPGRARAARPPRDRRVRAPRWCG